MRKSYVPTVELITSLIKLEKNNDENKISDNIWKPSNEAVVNVGEILDLISRLSIDIEVEE